MLWTTRFRRHRVLIEAQTNPDQFDAVDSKDFARSVSFGLRNCTFTSRPLRWASGPSTGGRNFSVAIGTVADFPLAGSLHHHSLGVVRGYHGSAVRHTRCLLFVTASVLQVRTLVIG